MNSVQVISLQKDFDALYNAVNTALTASKISLHGFRGQPQKVLAYRMATGAAQKGAVTLQDNGAVASLTLETLYPSDRTFVAVVRDSLTVGNKIVEIVEDSVQLAKAEAATAAGLAAQLNASDYVRVTATGANLPVNTAGSAFIGGHNGAPVTATEYTAFLATMEAEEGWQTFALDGVTDEAILTTAKEWVKRVRSEGLYVTMVRGGAAAWDADTASANTKSQAINHRSIINVGNGVDGYTAADMAIYVAARVASVPLNRTLTDEPLLGGYAAVNKKLTISQREAAKQAGTVLFIQRGAQVLIDEGVNTLTTPGANEKASMGKIRVNNALDQIVRDLEVFGEQYKRDLSNTEQGRITFAATIEQDYLRAYAAQEIIQPGYFYEPDPDYHGKNATHPAAPEESYFHADATPVDSMERIYQKINA